MTAQGPTTRSSHDKFSSKIRQRVFFVISSIFFGHALVVCVLGERIQPRASWAKSKDYLYNFSASRNLAERDLGFSFCSISDGTIGLSVRIFICASCCFFSKKCLTNLSSRE